MLEFSIIICAYNAEKYLEDCLESVAKQSYSDYELVLVDDGSTDRTARLFDSFVDTHPYIDCVVLHESNQGLLLARRAGLLKATGDYIIFLDADDCLRNDALDIISHEIEKHNPDIVSFRFSRNENYSSGDDKTSLSIGYYASKAYDEVKKQVCLGRFNNLCSKAFRRSCIDVFASYEMHKGLMQGEDLFQLLPIVDTATSLVRIGDILYYYRPSENASTAAFRKTQLEDIAVVNERLLKYATRWGVAFVPIAWQGVIMQYAYLAKLNELSKQSYSVRKHNFRLIVEAMDRQGVFVGCVTTGFPLYVKALYYAMKYKIRLIVWLASVISG